MHFFGKVLVAGVISFLALQNIAHAEVTTTTPNAISSPKESYPLLYTVNSQYAIVVKSLNGYHITFHGVAPNVAYKNAADKTGEVSMKQFVKYLQHKTAVIKGDVTGVQTNNKTIGQATFNASFTLSKPILSTQDNILRFEAEPLNRSDITIDKQARFNNATIFINGCGVCACNVDHENCIS
jgi:hypothetical protein